MVLGDHVQQYKRLRDYHQIIIDTNPRSRYIVTTKMIAEHPSKNPRFHVLFMCKTVESGMFGNYTIVSDRQKVCFLE